LEELEKAAGDDPPVPETSCRATSMIAEREHCAELEQRDPSSRRLRNWLIAANAIVWVVIIVLIRLIFF
jgi:hypothetical protein